MCEKAQDIAIVLTKIKEIVPPENKKHHRIIQGLIEDAFYKAPEICNDYWHIIHDNLTRIFNNGFVWEESVCMTYNEGYTAYFKKYKS